MSYQRTNLPAEYDGKSVQQEFERIEQALMLFDLLRLKQLNAEPSRPRDGMIVYADGTNWEPVAASGEGIYAFYASAWHKLG